MNASKTNAQLKKTALKYLPKSGVFPTEIEGLQLSRFDECLAPQCCFYNTKIVVVLQGRKRAKVGDEELVYGEGQCLIVGMDVPGTTCIVEGALKNPLITISLDIDKTLISHMLAEMPLEKLNGEGQSKGLTVGDLDEGMLGAFFRLLELLGKKDEQSILAPVIKREIYSRLLISSQGRHLREIFTSGTQSNQIMRAVEWLKSNFSKSLQVDELASSVGMATTTFHRHFKKITSSSPLQYQKRLRLHEAKRLIISESESVSSAAYAVGYESPAQFSREYKRLFGASPKRDIFR